MSRLTLEHYEHIAHGDLTDAQARAVASLLDTLATAIAVGDFDSSAAPSSTWEIVGGYDRLLDTLNGGGR